jgi:hypothetical protein
MTADKEALPGLLQQHLVIATLENIDISVANDTRRCQIWVESTPS